MKNLTVAKICTLVRLTEWERTGSSLRDQLATLIDGCPRLLLDIDGIQFNSMMLGDLVSVRNALRERWGVGNEYVAVLRPTNVTRQVMKLSKLDQAIPVFDDVESAWRSVEAPAAKG
jgi:hypothetical protein